MTLPYTKGLSAGQLVVRAAPRLIQGRRRAKVPRVHLGLASGGATFGAALEVTLAAAAVIVVLARSGADGRRRAARAVRAALPAALGFGLLAGGGGALLAEAYEATDPWPFLTVGAITATVALSARGARAAAAPTRGRAARIPRLAWLGWLGWLGWLVVPPLTVVLAVLVALATTFPAYLDSLLSHRWP